MKTLTRLVSIAALAFCVIPSGSVALAQTAANGGAQGKQAAYTVVFYNVENLFDTLDNPNKIDEEYMPGSDLKWTSARYHAKLDSLARVLRAAGDGKAPDLIGLAEIENDVVVRELGARVAQDEAYYSVAWFESPDMRGIDCALLYRNDKKGFKLLESRAISLVFPPEDTGYTSRDILYVRGRFPKMKADLHLFVNHWPSRRGGEQESEAKRVLAANTLLAEVNKLRAADPEAQIIIMGDFNDEPDNRSLKEVLCGGAGAGGELGAEPGANGSAHGGRGAGTDLTSTPLLNLMAEQDAQGLGSYNYRGNWNMLDQFVVSPVLLREAPARKTWQVSDAAPFRQEWMMYNDPRNGPTPSRTYGGPNYYAGYSDHLPIRLTLYRVGK